MINRIPDSEVKNIEEFLKPISKDEPCGPYLKRDPVILRLKELRLLGGESEQGIWKVKAQKSDPVSESLQIAENFLKNTSKDLSVVIYYTEALIKKYGFFGLDMGLSILNALCDMYWEPLHPGLDEEQAPLRMTAFKSLDTILNERLNLAPIVITHENVKICPFDISVEQQPTKVKNKIIAALTKETKDNLNFFKEKIQNSIKILESLRVRSEELDKRLNLSEAPNFNKQVDTLKVVLELVQSALNPTSAQMESIKEEGAQIAQTAQMESEAGGLKADMSLLKDTLKSIYDAYQMIENINEYLLKNDTHSPCPYLIKRATEWRKKNVYELYADIFASITRPDELFALLAIKPQVTQAPPTGAPMETLTSPAGGGYPPPGGFNPPGGAFNPPGGGYTPPPYGAPGTPSPYPGPEGGGGFPPPGAGYGGNPYGGGQEF